MKRWTRIKYQPNLPLKDGQYVTCGAAHRALAREAAKEGIVLLKNEQKLLPLKSGTKLAMFGKGVFDYVKGGGGSGAVLVEEETTLYDALSQYPEQVSLYEPLYDFYREKVKEQYAKDLVPGMIREPELPEDLIQSAKEYTDTALIVLSRFSGEGWDRSDVEYFDGFDPDGDETTMPKLAGQYYPEGDFYLTKEEKKMIRDVKASFSKIIVVLNIGGVIDTQWCKEDEKIGAVLNIWQGGMEGAQAAAEILLGCANPCGKLVDTFAKDVNSYPSGPGYHESLKYVDYVEDIYVGYRYFETIPKAKKEVCYPFGFGLSYTEFDIQTEEVWEEEDAIKFRIKVTNIGTCAGKEVVQIYYSAPQGALGKPVKELGAFAKTRNLEPGKSQMLELIISKDSMASYDDLGKIQKAAYVLEKGEYAFAVGNSVVDCEYVDLKMVLTENVVVEQLSTKCTPTSLKERMISDGSFEVLPQSTCNDMNACVFEKMMSGTEEGIAPAIRGRGQ
ncbi:MAG: glycoside hydrolase family 3 C-terminal domain-containing protein, partial [Dorea sp.]